MDKYDVAPSDKPLMEVECWGDDGQYLVVAQSAYPTKDAAREAFRGAHGDCDLGEVETAEIYPLTACYGTLTEDYPSLWANAGEKFAMFNFDGSDPEILRDIELRVPVWIADLCGDIAEALEEQQRMSTQQTTPAPDVATMSAEALRYVAARCEGYEQPQCNENGYRWYVPNDRMGEPKAFYATAKLAWDEYVPDYPDDWAAAGTLWEAMVSLMPRLDAGNEDTKDHYTSLWPYRGEADDKGEYEVPGSYSSAPHAITVAYITAAIRGWLGEERQALALVGWGERQREEGR